MDNPVVGIDHYENFPVASVLCPPRLRAPIRAIYTFARTADDLADEGDATPPQRLADLGRFRQALLRVSGTVPAPTDVPWPELFVPLAQQIRRHRLPMPLLLDLLDAFEQDVRNPRYESRDALLDYCRRSANPIGRLLLHLYGIDDDALLRASDAICSALQLVNFWQDLSVDVSRGRIYLPMTDCKRHGIEPERLADPANDAAACALVADLVHWTAQTMAEGAQLPLRVPGRAGWELRLVMHGGWRILEKIAHMRFRSHLRRPRLVASDMPLLAWRSLCFSSRQFEPHRLA
ncbi:MAG: squalene synthase HpnC [Burkholderiaceae bacterium]|jgi:squalene synthase HpnC|nr:squalene synthase HpnC [Burkholderiaceae bacterium]